ncbi:MAG TPA: glycosyltransferase family A protein [Acidimicrobiales bacterium]
MSADFELVVLQQHDGTPSGVMRELASFGSGFTLVQLNEPASDDQTIDLVFTALARNQATQRSDADWVVFLDAGVALQGRWLDQLRADLQEADSVAGPISVADDGTFRDAGRRADIAYRRDFLVRSGGFPIGAEVAGQEDLLLGLRCMVENRPILRGRRRSERMRGVAS